MADRNKNDGSTHSNGGEENRFSVGETGGDKTGEQQSDAISQRDHEKERARFTMAQLQIFFNRGHQRRQNNTREEIQEEDSYEKEKGNHPGTERGKLCFHFLISNTECPDEIFLC
jgi:hypothetical protein